MKTLRIKQNGFSLIEILIAIAVSAVVFPAVISLISLSTFTTSQGETYTKAYTLAQKDMELAYEKKQDWNTFKTLSAIPITSPTPGFNETITITTIDPDERKVLVTVSWIERGSTQDLKIESYVANR